MMESRGFEKKAEEKLVNKLRFILVEWAKASSSHGLPNIASSRHKHLKIIWTIAFLGCISICFYLILLTLLDYRTYPVNINIQEIIENPTYFPAVTICNLNPFNSMDTSVHEDLIKRIPTAPILASPQSYVIFGSPF